MDARSLALARVTLGVVALAACFSPGPGWHVAAAAVAGVASLALIAGFWTRSAALVAAVALTLAAPTHALLRLLLVLLAATDPGARGSIDAVLHPSRAHTRAATLAVDLLIFGAALGLGVQLMHHRLVTFDLLAALAVAPVLLPGELLGTLVRAVAARTAPIEVIYDGKCSFCRRSVDTLLALDVLQRIEPRDSHDPAIRAAHPTLDPERTQREMVVFVGDRLEGGFDAFRLMAWKLPALWPAIPFLYLPPVPQLGRVVYRYIAANRLKLACELNVTAPKRPTPDASPRELSPLAAAALMLVALGLETLLALAWL